MKPLEPSSLLSLQLEPITRHINRVMVVNKFVFIDIDRMIYYCKYNGTVPKVNFKQLPPLTPPYTGGETAW